MTMSFKERECVSPRRDQGNSSPFMDISKVILLYPYSCSVQYIDSSQCFERNICMYLKPSVRSH